MPVLNALSELDNKRLALLKEFAPWITWEVSDGDQYKGFSMGMPVIIVDMKTRTFAIPSSAFLTMYKYKSEFTLPGARFILESGSVLDFSGNVRPIKNYLTCASKVLKMDYISTERKKIYEESKD